MKLQKRLSSIVLKFENLTCMNFYHLHCINRGKIFQRDAQFGKLSNSIIQTAPRMKQEVTESMQKVCKERKDSTGTLDAAKQNNPLIWERNV